MALETPFGNQPGQLADPIPGAAAQPDNPFSLALEQSNAGVELDQPQAQAAPIAEVAPEVNPFAAALGQEQPMSGDLAQDDLSPLPAPTGLASAKEQIGEFSTRLKNAFTTTDKESLDVLKQSGIFADARYKDGRLQVKRPGRKGFENFDRDKIELLGDTVDLTRMAFEGIVENMFRAGGAVSGGVIGGGAGAAEGAVVGSIVPGAGTAAGAITGGGLGTVLGAATGASAGGAAGAITAIKAGDFVAEELLGITADSARDKVSEARFAGILGAGFSMLAAGRSRAKVRGEFRRAEAKKTLDFTKKQIDETTQSIQDVRDAGFRIDGEGRFSFDPQQSLKGADPELNVEAKNMSKIEGFNTFRREQGEKLTNAYNSMIEYLGAKAGKTDSLGKDFVLGAKEIQAAEGAILGNVRKMGKIAAEGRPVPAPKLLEVVQGFDEVIGDVSTKDGMQKAIDGILRQRPGLTEAHAKSFIGEITDIKKLLAKNQGAMTIDSMEVIYNRLTKTINRGYKSANGTAYSNELVEFKNIVRDEWTEMLGKVLPDESMESYAKSKAAYSTFKQSEDTLRNVLKNENISRRELVDKLFSNKTSLKFAKSAKTMFQDSDPKFWKQLTTEYFEKLGRDNFDETLGVMNWKSMQKTWQKLGPEMQAELSQGSGMNPKGFKQMLNMGRIYQHTNFSALPKDVKENVAEKAAVIAFFPFIGTRIKAAMSLMSGIGKDESMMMWLKEGGAAAVVKKMHNLTPRKRDMFMQAVNEWTPRAVKVGRVPGRQKIQDKVQRGGPDQ